MNYIISEELREKILTLMLEDNWDLSDADVVKDLRNLAHLQQAQQGDGWIPVTERLPEGNARYLVLFKTGYLDTHEWYWHNWSSLPSGAEITHWQPLPFALVKVDDHE